MSAARDELLSWLREYEGRKEVKVSRKRARPPDRSSVAAPIKHKPKIENASADEGSGGSAPRAAPH